MKLSDYPSAFWDFLPTAAELTGTRLIKPTDGISMVPALTGKGVQKEYDFFKWMYNRIIMRYVVAFIIVILSFQGPVSAQERDTLVEAINTHDKMRELPEFPGRQMSPGAAALPFLFQDFKSGFDLQNPALRNMNFNSVNGWKIETGTLMDLRSINSTPFVNSPFGLYGRSAWDIYQGTYGIRTYEVNNKLYVGTAGYSDKSFNDYSHKSGTYLQTNYSSSLFVGYKFSEKFSISAGFTIQRNGDPLNRNQGWQNGGMFP